MAEKRYLQRILAPNPSPMTLDGTNTWVVGDPADHPSVVIDPGPLDEDHLEHVLRQCGGQISWIVITHRHADHAEGADRLASLAGCPILTAEPDVHPAGRPLRDAEVLSSGRVQLTAYATPGHTSDSFSLLVHGPDGEHRLLTGDMVLGRGTTVITRPDGDLGDYLSSLRLMRDLVDRHQVQEILPGHGPVVTDPAEVLEHYRRHRLERLEQVRAALKAGDRTPADVVARVYSAVDPALWPAAEQSVAAQLDYLQQNP